MEILEAVIYVKNRSPARPLGSKTPYGMLYGKKPDLSTRMHCRFNCVEFYWLGMWHPSSSSRNIRMDSDFFGTLVVASTGYAPGLCNKFCNNHILKSIDLSLELNIESFPYPAINFRYELKS